MLGIWDLSYLKYARQCSQKLACALIFNGRPNFMPQGLKILFRIARSQKSNDRQRDPWRNKLYVLQKLTNANKSIAVVNTVT